MNKVVRIAGTIAAAATLPLITMGTASAASTPQSFNLSTQSGGVFAGYGTVSGAVTFVAAKDWHWNGTVTDRCPKDGAGAYVNYQVKFTDGSVATHKRWIADTSGCDDKVSFSWAVNMPTESKSVAAIRVYLQECDQVSSTSWNCSTNSADIKYSTWKDNPYT